MRQNDNVSRALKAAETDLLWNFLVEVALNTDDTQRKRLHDELSPGLANVQVCVCAPGWLAGWLAVCSLLLY